MSSILHFFAQVLCIFTNVLYFAEVRQLIDDYIYIYIYNHQRIQTKTKLTPLELRSQFIA